MLPTRARAAKAAQEVGQRALDFAHAHARETKRVQTGCARAALRGLGNGRRASNCEFLGVLPRYSVVRVVGNLFGVKCVLALT